MIFMCVGGISPGKGWLIQQKREIRQNCVRQNIFYTHSIHDLFQRGLLSQTSRFNMCIRARQQPGEISSVLLDCFDSKNLDKGEKKCKSKKIISIVKFLLALIKHGPLFQKFVNILLFVYTGSMEKALSSLFL